MVPGIKIGPQSWKGILSEFRPHCCEVWFRVDWIAQYQEMFAFLKKESLPTGLHFWGILPGGIMPNFAFPEKEVRKKSLQLVKNTIDIASSYGFYYVNIHPGSYFLEELDLDRSQMRIIDGRITTSEEGRTVLIDNIQELHDYSSKQKVHLFTETIPSREPDHWRDMIKGRSKTHNPHNVPVSMLEHLAKLGLFITNDFCHTAADVISDNRDHLFQELFSKTKRLAPQTKLVHLNTMPEPFNGTDGHLGIRNEDFENDVFPTRDQLKQLLRLFKDRDDVWAIPEPFDHHIDNSKALEALLEELEEEG